MTGNLAAIGFEFESPLAFQTAMLGLAGAAIERLGCPDGDYSIWRSRTGAEIWFHLPVFGSEDEARDIAGLTPFFEGESEVALDVVARIVRAGDNAFEGAFAARLKDGRDGPIEMQFDAVDFAAHDGRPLPFHCTARIVGFVGRGRVVDSVPDAAVGVRLLQGSVAALTGRIVERRALVNEARVNEPGGGRFDWLLVACGGAAIDIVAAPGAIEGGAAIGASVQMTATLFGRLIE